METWEALPKLEIMDLRMVVVVVILDVFWRWIEWAG
jgi:hypothetical protein